MNPILFQKVEELGFKNTRVVSALESANIQYVGELVQMNSMDLLKTRNFGRVALQVVAKRLSELKLRLGMTIPWPKREAYDAHRPSNDQYFGIEERYRHAVEALRKTQGRQAFFAKAAEIGELPTSILATSHGVELVPCPRHPQAGTWESSSGSRCAICAERLDGTPPPPARPARTILGWQRLAHAVATSKGFYEKRPLNFGEQIALMHCELSETMEEWRKGKGPTEIYYREDGKPEGIPIELADVVLRVMQWSQELGIDLEAAMLEKNTFNETREYMHGKKA